MRILRFNESANSNYIINLEDILGVSYDEVRNITSLLSDEVEGVEHRLSISNFKGEKFHLDFHIKFIIFEEDEWNIFSTSKPNTKFVKHTDILFEIMDRFKSLGLDFKLSEAIDSKSKSFRIGIWDIGTVDKVSYKLDQYTINTLKTDILTKEGLENVFSNYYENEMVGNDFASVNDEMNKIIKTLLGIKIDDTHIHMNYDEYSAFEILWNAAGDKDEMEGYEHNDLLDYVKTEIMYDPDFK